MVGLTLDVMIPNAYALTLPSYNEQIAIQKDNLWNLGKNLSRLILIKNQNEKCQNYL